MNVDTSLGGVTGPFFEVSEYRSSLNSCRIEWSINLFNRESSIPPGKNTLLWDFSQLRDGKLPILSLRHLHFILVGSSFVVKGMKGILERYRTKEKVISLQKRSLLPNLSPQRQQRDTHP